MPAFQAAQSRAHLRIGNQLRIKRVGDVLVPLIVIVTGRPRKVLHRTWPDEQAVFGGNRKRLKIVDEVDKREISLGRFFGNLTY